MTTTLTEDEFKQLQETGLGMAALAIIGGRGGRQLSDERNTTESLKFREHGEKIESLEKEIEKKDNEIVVLQKALQGLQEQNDELKSALNSKDVEIDTLKSRIDELEEEKRELQRKLGSVEFDLGLLKKEVDKLGKAKSNQEETILKLKQDFDRVWRNMEIVKGDLEKKRKENEDLKKEMKEFKDSQHKGLLPLMLGARALPNKPSQMIPKTSLDAMLHLGEMCRQIQTKMYKFVFPKSVKNINYKVEAIYRHLKKYQNPEAQKKWDTFQEKFHWSETHEEAISILQETRNAEAHPEISKESIKRAISITDEANNLDDSWLSLQLLNELLHIWETELS